MDRQQDKPKKIPRREFDLIEFMGQQRAFSRETFGPGMRTKGIVEHIRKELDEILAKPHDAEEWIDVVILALDGALRSGPSPVELSKALQAKFEKNKARKWPDWRTVGEDKAIEHVREPEEAPKVEPTRARMNHYLAMTPDEIISEIYDKMRGCSFLQGIAYTVYYHARTDSISVFLTDYFAIERASIKKETEDYLTSLRLPFSRTVSYRCAKDGERP